MADDNTGANGPEDERIDVDAAGSVEKWAQKFDTTPEQIRQALQDVGNRAADVEMHLKGSHSTTNADREAQVDAMSKQD